MRSSIRLLMYVALFVALGYLALSVYEAPARLWTAVKNLPVSVLVVTTLMLLFGHILGALHWHLAIGMYAVPGRFIESLQIWTTTRIGRYVPGKVAQYVGRLYSYRGQYRASEIIGASVIEGGSMTISAAAVCALGLGLLFDGWILVSLVCAGLALLGILIEALNVRNGELLERLVCRLGGSAIRSIVPTRVAFERVIGLNCTAVLQILVYSTAFVILVAGSAPLSTHTHAMVGIAFVGASWIGQVISVAPAGLGVREGALIALLEAQVEVSVILVAAVVIRLASLCAEVVLLLMLAIVLGIKSVGWSVK